MCTVFHNLFLKANSTELLAHWISACLDVVSRALRLYQSIMLWIKSLKVKVVEYGVSREHVVCKLCFFQSYILIKFGQFFHRNGKRH